jgi:hypothetical protein
MLTDQTTRPEYCPRESALCWDKDLNAGTAWIPTSLRMTFQTGHALQELATKALLPDLYGDWHCHRCERERRGYLQGCCGMIPEYREMFFRSPSTGVVGSVDMCVKMPGHDKPVLIEVKSIEKDKFKDLFQPLIEHRLRMIGYLTLVQEIADAGVKSAQEIETGFGLVLYIAKGFGIHKPQFEDPKINDRFSPFKEYEITRDGNPKEIVDEMFDRARSYWQFRKGGPLPERIKSCNDKHCKRAEKCAARDECYAEQ